MLQELLRKKNRDNPFILNVAAPLERLYTQIIMDKSKKLDLLKRSLGLKHKLKVHDSTKAPEGHEEVAKMLVAKWDFEDEIQAIEGLLQDARVESVKKKREQILKELAAGGTLSKNKDELQDDSDETRGNTRT